MEKKRSFSSSEEFARSLEPHYNPKPSAEEPATKMPGSPAHPGPAKPKPSRRAPKKERLADPHAPRRRKRFETASGVFLFLLLFFVMLLAVSTDSGPFLVLMGLLPSVFTVVFSLLLYEASIDNRKALWVVPIFLVALFYWYGESGTGIFTDLDVGVLSAVNLIASFLFLIVTTFILQAPGKAPVKKVVRRVEQPKDEDLPSFIASIEDKGKALNFTIGRVYNAYHGGSKQLRDRVKIEQEWYDQFSHLPSDPSKIDFEALISLIRRIEGRLKLLEKTEAEVFGEAHKGFKNLVRDATGKDRVIDVLDRNDKDPVKTYVDGALEFCGKVKDYARQRRAPGVENEYAGDDGGSKAPRSSSWSSSLEK